MAISKDKKQALVAEMSELFASAKAIAVAKYQGTSVAELQELRKAARENGVVVKVVKNRLVRVAFAASETFKETDTSALQGQLIYAVSSDDEVMAAKVLNDFAKTHPSVKLVAGFSGEGWLAEQESAHRRGCGTTAQSGTRRHQRAFWQSACIAGRCGRQSNRLSNQSN